MAVFVLQEVTDELVEHALIPRIDVHLREHFEKGINCTDCFLVGARHALDLVAVLLIIAIDRK